MSEVSRLKELRLHGFKSFAEPTRFVFAPGVNAVIGPNGSGKSNMADAVRWVLGEQSNRSLRTRRSDDVIFAGSEQRKAQGMAEAILTLDNADGWLPIDFAEVTIGRRAYRSGEGEYLINGARARLRDVVDLLASGRLGANELVVVGQGTVDAALSLRPDERRQLFEEAAGVKNLQVRKNEAGTRLARARDNLERVADLVGELKPQVRRLALQAAHQQEHEALGQRARTLIEASQGRRERSARAALGEARRAAAGAEAALEAHRAEQAAGHDAVAAAEARYWEAEAVARRAGEAREATREALIRAEGRADSVAARLRDAEALLERGQHGLQRAEAELATSAGAVADAEIAPLLAAAAAGDDRWRAAVEELAAADAELVAAEEALADVRLRESGRIAEAAQRAEDEARAAARRERAEVERAEAVRVMNAARQRAGVADEEVRMATAALDEARSRLDETAAERDEAQLAADETHQRSAEGAQWLAILRAERQALSERMQSGRLGSQLAQAGWTELLEAFEAPDDAWPAIEAVVGGELETALLWREGELGLPLEGARGTARLLHAGSGPPPDRDAALGAVGAVRTLAEWVGVAHMPAVFHRAAVAPDLDALLAGWQRLPAGWCAVTLHGDLADGRGLLVVRGRGDPPGSLAARDRARRRELDAAIGREESELAAAAAAAHATAERLRAVRELHLAARDAHDAAEEAARRARATAADASGAVGRAEREVARLDAEAAPADPGEAEPGEAVPGEALAAPTPTLADRERRALGARRQRDLAAAARDEAREAWNAARRAAEQAETRAAGQVHGHSLLEARIAQLRADQPKLRRDREELLAAAAESQATLAAARGADAAAAAERAAREQDRELRRAELLELERGSAGGVARLADLERAAQATAVEALRRDDALAALARERELAMEGLPASATAEASRDPDVAELDDEALEAELRRVRRTLAQIGSVNPFAVEEHRELAARLDDFTAQSADLQAAIGSTQELIARLDAQIAEQFDAAFRAIGERFDEYCRLLFAGGSAALQMADEADGDAPGGIEIVVRPPGKRLQRLAMLSGGERALTGVALLFAMLTVNPVPFCILDEVDAALDEANIGRFADALRRLAESIDFVVITHNRATIEVADTVYGVTMTDAAVSRVLSLRLADLPVEASA